MPITNTLVPSIQQSIVRDTIGIDISLDLGESPVCQRIDLDQPSLVNLNDIQRSSLAALTLSSTGKDSLDPQLGVSPLGRLNLGKIVVEVIVGFPELVTVKLVEFIGSFKTRGLVDVEFGSRVVSLAGCDEFMRFFEVEEGIKEDEVDGVVDVLLGSDLRDHVKSDETGETEGGGLEEVWECDHAPSDDV